MRQSLSRESKQSGFTAIEVTIVILILGIIVAFAAPTISRAMRRYRLNMASRQLSDLTQRVRMQAISDSRRSSLLVDTSGGRLGIITYNQDGSINTQQYVPLPNGIQFDRPSGLTAPIPGAPTGSNVSFPPSPGSTTEFQQDFNSRGFPVVATPGAVNVVYLGNGISYSAVTLSSVGSVRTWLWENSTWISTKAYGQAGTK